MAAAGNRLIKKEKNQVLLSVALSWRKGTGQTVQLTPVNTFLHQVQDFLLTSPHFSALLFSLDPFLLESSKQSCIATIALRDGNAVHFIKQVC